MDIDLGLDEIDRGRGRNTPIDFGTDPLGGVFSDLNEGSFIDNGGMRPSRCTMIVTGSYQQQVRRSYECNFIGDHVDDIREIYESSPTNDLQIDIVDVAGVANKCIRPSISIDRTIDIANSWATPRISFILEFVRPLAGGASMVYTYNGFTDYVGANEDGDIDPSMRMHFTSCVVTSYSYNTDNRVITKRVRDTNIVVNEVYYSEDNNTNINRRFRNSGNDEYLITPDAIIEYESARNSYMTEDLDGSPLMPKHARIGRGARSVNRYLNNPAYYIAKTVNVSSNNPVDDYDPMSASDGILGDSDGTRIRRTLASLRTSAFNQDPLAQLFRELNFSSSATLTWGDLTELFSTLNDDRITEIHFPANLSRVGGSLERRLLDAGQETLDSDSWSSSHGETITATSIVQQLPNLMVSEMIQSIRFTVTNEITSFDPDERYAWVIGDGNRRSRDNRDAIAWYAKMSPDIERRRLRSFMDKFEITILDPITLNGEIPINLMIDCATNGDTVIYMSYNGGHEVKYVMPTFADALTSPIITSDSHRFTDFAKDMVSFVEQVVN